MNDDAAEKWDRFALELSRALNDGFRQLREMRPGLSLREADRQRESSKSLIDKMKTLEGQLFRRMRELKERNPVDSLR